MSAAAVVLAGALLAPESRQSAEGAPSLVAVRALFDEGDFQSAIRIGEMLVQNEPRSSEARDMLGRAYGRRAEESGPVAQIKLAKKARAAFEQAVSLDPANAAALSDLATYDMEAPRLFGGSRARAREMAGELLRLEPWRGHVLLGRLAEKDANASEADRQYRSALAARPEEPVSRHALSDYLVRHGRFAEARALWSPPLAPAGAEALCAYERAGIALAASTSLDLAVAALLPWLEREAELGDVRPAEILTRASELEERLGRHAEARAHAEEALRREPQRRAYKKRLAQLPR